jgi:purine-nucleoside phosphorylase
MVGRLHIYEGYTSEEVTRPVQALAKLGLKYVVLTAAAGGLCPDYQVGDFVVMNDMITAFCQSPLTGPQFVDLSAAFDPQLGDNALKLARHLGYSAHQGAYCFVRGPHFETPIDKRLYRQLGADVVGMSLVPETIMARSLGVKVLGIAFVTNLAFVVHDHQDVLAAAHAGSAKMSMLLSEIISSLE